MAFVIKAHVNAAKNIVVQNKNTGLSITTNTGTYYANTNGAITVPLVTKDDANYILRELPLSQFGDLYDSSSFNITSNGFVLTFNKAIPMFMAGVLTYMPIASYNLALYNTPATNQTFCVYVKLDQGEPTYDFSVREQSETEVCMFVGKITTNATQVTSNSISKVSRFSTYRPSITKIGAAFPVSTGNPAQTGTINW